METETLIHHNSPAPGAAGSDPAPPRPPGANRAAPGLGPTPDPTRSGALWVGGAGVTLLLAAAAVLTAVRWDEIGQSVKLGGLVAITLALLAAGQRFKDSIPMTAQAIFHLGALLIPFDMAAVAILAGRSWQETLLLTSITSVVAWYSIERAVPSKVLLWCAHLATIAMAAGVASVSAIAMPLALALIAPIALVVRRPIPSVLWAFTAGMLPIASFVTWPPRIAGAMLDLGFDELDRWQPLAAGAVATLTLVGVTRLLPRVEIAWSAVTIAAITAIVAFAGFADAQVSFVSLAMLFLSLELLALFSAHDPFWKRVTEPVAWAAEVVAIGATAVLLAASLVQDAFEFAFSPASFATAAFVFGVGWLTADRRRLQDGVDWMTALIVGSDWPLTTVMFPAAVLAGVIAMSAPPFAIALTAVVLAYWMVATWRTGAVYGAIGLTWIAVIAAVETDRWIEFALGGAAVAVLVLAARLRMRANDLVGSVLAMVSAVFVLLITSQTVIVASATGWPVVLVLGGAWAMSWAVEAQRRDRGQHPADWAGRLTAGAVLVSSLWMSPIVALVSCGAVMLLASIDYLAANRSSLATTHPLVILYGVAVGAALGLAGMPIVELFGLGTAAGGASLAVASFVLAGIALASPRLVELPLGVAAVLATTIGFVMATADAGMFAIAVMAAGCTTIFVGAAFREWVYGIAGYAVFALGFALQLSVWEVTWLEPYLALPALAALAVGYRHHRRGGSSWVAYAPTIALMGYVALADRFAGGSAWHAVIAGAVGVFAIIGGGYRRLVGPLVTGSVLLGVVVVYESLGPAALVPTWAWLAAGGTILLAAGVAMERSDTTPLERGQQIRNVIATQFS